MPGGMKRQEVESALSELAALAAMHGTGVPPEANALVARRER